MRAHVAFITGGAQGIGLAMARSFAQAGARVAVADADQEALDAVRAALEGSSGVGRVAFFQLDVRDRKPSRVRPKKQRLGSAMSMGCATTPECGYLMRSRS